MFENVRGYSEEASFDLLQLYNVLLVCRGKGGGGFAFQLSKSCRFEINHERFCTCFASAIALLYE